MDGGIRRNIWNIFDIRRLRENDRTISEDAQVRQLVFRPSMPSARVVVDAYRDSEQSGPVPEDRLIDQVSPTAEGRKKPRSLDPNTLPYPFSSHRPRIR